MLFGVKIRPFVRATSRHSRRGFAPVANVAAIGRPKMAYRDVEKNSSKQKFSTDWIHFCFIWELICMATFVSLEVENVSAQ